MKSFLSTIVAGCAYLFLASVSRAQDIEWTPEANMDHQLFPSLIIATASVRPVEPDDQEAEKPDPYLLGERFGLVGVSVKAPAENSKVKVTLKENDLMATASWSGELAEVDKDYFIAPKVNYKFEKLRQMTQQVPLNITFELEVDGEPAGEKYETLQVRSINDCPFGVANSEETLNDENFIAGSADLGWMFAAYVNENHPMLDKVLQEALETKIVSGFRVTTHEHDETLKQVFALWSALQKRGLQYSSTTTTPGGSDTVQSQYVRFIDQSLTNTQANCVDGSVLFASLLRKISIEPFLVTVPGHMYVGFYLGAGKSQFIGLETTILGLPDVADEKKPGDPAALTAVRDKLDASVRARRDWKTFAKAVQVGTEDLAKNKEKLNAGDPSYQWIDLSEARTQGIMPIPYSAAP
ncbi:MAG: hypothetical protein DME97_04500 [Verrucomicrobia bacterium]|nr:MAG: hypothetical protein DME97_04500 [Verrucomicrobiota bacterium]